MAPLSKSRRRRCSSPPTTISASSAGDSLSRSAVLLLAAFALLTDGAAGRLSSTETVGGVLAEPEEESAPSSGGERTVGPSSDQANNIRWTNLIVVNEDEDDTAESGRDDDHDRRRDDGEWPAAVGIVSDGSAEASGGISGDDEAGDTPSLSGLRAASRSHLKTVESLEKTQETQQHTNASSSEEWSIVEEAEVDARELQSSSKVATLETTFVGGSRSHGNMFDIQAKKDMSILGLNVHCGTISRVQIELYTRSGSHSGFEHSANAWTLLGSGPVWCEGAGRPTALPASFFPSSSSSGGGRRHSGDVLEVMAGERRAFYVSMGTPDVYYTTGYRGKGAAEAWNADLTVFAGNGIGYKKYGYPIFAPRVWNGAVHYRVQANEYGRASDDPNGLGLGIASSTIGKEMVIETIKTGSTGSYGNMFDITAKSNILIKGFNIHTRKKQVTVTVYSRPGSYVGVETDESGWTLMLPPTTLSGQGQGHRTSIPSARFIPMDIKVGEARAFYVKLQTSDLRYSKPAYSEGVGDVLASNGDLAVLWGSGVGSVAFGEKPFEPRAFNGDVKYAVESYVGGEPSSSSGGTSMSSGSSSFVQGLPAMPASLGTSSTSSSTPRPPERPNATPSSSFPTSAPRLPPTDKYKNFVTDFAGDNGSYGNMFSVAAPDRDIIIRSLAIHVGSTEPVQARVWFRGGSYEGHENEPVGWVSVMSVTDIDGEGYLRPTELPRDRFRPVKIPAGKIGSFYVTLLQKKIRYTNWDGRGSFVVNSDIIVTNGVGIGGYPFGVAFEDRMWNGIVRYELASSWLS